MKRALICLTFVVLCECTALAETERPNFIVIFADDLGYSDIGCFGSVEIRTPHLDQMAREGMRFDNFYAQNVCGPSRSALLTGCYPLRNAKKNNRVTTHPFLHLREVTIAEVLKQRGYATGCFGKWDQAGHSQTQYDPALMPNAQGFDYFFGTPSSNDRVIRLLRNEEVIETNASMATITQRLTDEAIAFIRKCKDQPFFVYLPHPMPHLKLAASEEFRGKSKRGLYGDVVEELDYHVGRILSELKAAGREKSTYVIFTNDNGPWYLDKHKSLRKQRDAGGSHGGNAEPLRGHKCTAWEGGARVPCIVWAPGRGPAGTLNSEIARTLDVLPTFAQLAGAEVPGDRVIDGKDIRDLIHGVEGAKSPSNSFLYYTQTQLRAVRKGKWKLHLPVTDAFPQWHVYTHDNDLVDHSRPLLYNLEEDVSETTNLADQHTEKVAELVRMAEAARRDIGDYNVIGKRARFFALPVLEARRR